MENWKIGIVGSGMIADIHAQAIESLPNTRLVGFCDLIKEKAAKMAQKHKVKSWGTISSMLQSDEIEMVLIGTPSVAQMEPAIKAAKYDKHVLCEKPLEIKLDRIDKMIDAHEKSGTYLGGIFNFGFNETTQIIKNHRYQAVGCDYLCRCTCSMMAYRYILRRMARDKEFGWWWRFDESIHPYGRFATIPDGSD